MRYLIYGLGLVLGLACSHAHAASATACQPDPLAGRALFLRGSFNSWGANDAQRFHWTCNRYQLTTVLNGKHLFKVGDEAWSADADFGKGPEGADMLAIKGTELSASFAGTYRFSLVFAEGAKVPTLQTEICPRSAPLGDTTLYMRGSHNNWAALDDFAFKYSCDAYYLNVKLLAPYEFKVADAAGTQANSFGQGAGNFSYAFNGEHTVRLALDGPVPQLTVGPKSFPDTRVKSVENPIAASLQFDSRDVVHKAPFGAVKAGTTIAFGVSALPGVTRLTLVVEKRKLEGNQEVLEYTPHARVPMVARTEGKRQRWTASHQFADIAVYGYWFEAEVAGQIYVLQNNAIPVYWTRERGAGGAGEVIEKPAALKTLRRYRQTVYSPSFTVPSWAPDVVYYYIFPDRFRNGDVRNDPQPGVAKYHEFTVEKHASWMDLPWKPATNDGSDAHFNNDFFGGDIAGIIQKLDYIRDLGANTLYITPMFKASSNHKYDTADYKTIDPGFGTNDEFTQLTREASKRGIRVIPDTSLNHVGADSLYFDRYGNYSGLGAFEGGKPQPDSPYASWFTFDTQQTEPNKQFRGWVGVTDLPEVDKANPAFRRFAYGDQDSVMKTWLDRGASGWRMDVAPWVPDDFWREWRTAIKTHRPDALTVAETWFDASKYFLGDMFDSTMNYIFRNTVQDYAAGGNAKDLYPNIEQMREAYPAPAFYALMNLLSSHDQARALDQFGWHADTTDTAKIALAKQRLKLAVFFQMTFPGAPTVYYGDEVSVTGGDDPFNRATYPWADQGGKPDVDMLATFKQLIGLRNAHAVLRRGSIDAPLHLDAHSIVLLRRLGKQVALVATNNSSSPKTVTVQLPKDTNVNKLVNAMDQRLTYKLPNTGAPLTITIPPLFGVVLLGAAAK